MPGTDAPLSARNPDVQHVRRLARRRTARSESGQYLIEGPTLVEEAVEAGVPIVAAYVADDADTGTGTELSRAVDRLDDAGVTVRRLAAGVLEKVSDTVHPQGLVAVAAGRALTLDELLVRSPSGLVLALAGVSDPGNAGTLVRTAEATGAAAVVFLGSSVDPLSPKVVRASAGSTFRMSIVHERDPQRVEQLRERGFRLVGTTPAGGVHYADAALDGDVVLLLGNEAHGLGPGLAERLDEQVVIPMEGRVESLNVAVAGALLCFEHVRRRSSSKPPPP